jgi:AraC-like DNA-binding protein
VPPEAPYTIPIQRVQTFARLALHKGWDIEAMMRDAGVSSILLSAGRARVTEDQAARLFQQLWRVTDDELLDLGLAPVPRGTFLLMCYGLLGAADLEAAIQRFIKFDRAIPGFPPVTLSSWGHEARLSFDISGVARPVDLVIDALLTAAHRFMSWAIGKRLLLRHVEVPYPHDVDVDDYDVIFGAPVVFSASEPTLVFAADILAAPIVRDEASLVTFLGEAPRWVVTFRSYATSVASQVRRRLESGLAGEWPTIDGIAAELAMSPQTLRRKLREERTSARDIKEEVLRDAAIASLVRGDETVAALSHRLGFSEPSAFSRAFRRWTGTPPSSYQKPGLTLTWLTFRTSRTGFGSPAGRVSRCRCAVGRRAGRVRAVGVR